MRRRLKPIIWLLVLAAVVTAAVIYRRKRKAASEAPEIRTAQVERRDVVVAVSAVGVLEALTTVDVKANVAGEIVELAVDRGDSVSEGDLIARIDPTETQSAYDQAEADLAAALARVREVESNLERERRLAPAQVSAAEAAVEGATSRIKQAESGLEFQKQVTEANVRSGQQSLEASQARLRQAEARAQAQPALTKASIQQAEAQLQAARESLKRLKEATHPQEAADAKAEMDAARVTVQNDRQALDRLRHLFDEGYVSRQEVEDAEKRLADSERRHLSAKAAFDSLEAKHAAETQEAQAGVREAEAALDAARANEIEVDVLAQELNAADASVREADAALAADRANEEQDAAKLEELQAARAAADEARSQLAVAKANMLQIDALAHQLTQAKAQTRRAQAQLDNARKNLGYTTIRAPRDGLVIDRFVEQGTVITSGRSSITQGTNIVTLADVSRMFVLAEVDEADIGQVALGQPVEIEVETFPDETIAGTVTQIYPKGEEIENVTIFRVRIEVADPPSKLRPGMTAEASIIIDRRENVLAVPNEALYEQKGKSFVEVLKNGKPEELEVQTGIASFEWTEVKSGLEEGQEVVVTGGGGLMGAGGPDSRQQMRRMMRMGGRRR